MGLITQLLNVPTTDPEDARRGRLLNILLFGMAAIAAVNLLATAITDVTGLVHWDSATSLIYLGSLVALAGMVAIFLMNRYWSGWLATTLFLLLLTAIVALSDEPRQIVEGRSMFLFAIPILMASVLVRPWASFAMAALSSLLVAPIALFSLRIVPPLPSMLGFFAIAFVAWLSARSLERALQDLRTVNRELDLRVAERTRDLAETLAREHAAATRNQAILEGIADGVIVFDRGGKALVANSAIIQLLGLTPKHILGKRIDALIEPRLSDVDRDIVADMLADQSARYPSVKIQWDQKTLSISSAPVRDRAGVVTGSVAVFRDFTREAELDRMKSDFVSIASHELRTPLTSIRGYLDLLNMGRPDPLTEQQRSFLQVARDNTERLHQLVNDLLDISRIESGRIELDVQVVSLAEILGKSASLVRNQFVQRGLTLDLDLPPDLPRVFADPKRIGQVVTNLLSNAYKYTPEGGATVHAHASNGTIQVDVKDTGIGISDEDRSKLFTQFFRAESDFVREQSGTGLGLNITRSLVEMHGGRIWVESEPGQGSTFSFTLPLPKGKADGTAPGSGIASSAAHPTRWNTLHLVVVDDEPDIAHLFRQRLEREGYRVTVVTESARAVEAVRRLQPDLVTLDLVMEKDGLTILRELKADPHTSAIPVVIVSVVSQAKKGWAWGAADYLVKPVDSETLLNSVASILGRSEDASGKSILVVDDEPDIVSWLQHALALEGYRVTTAFDGIEALDVVSSDPPDLILLDLLMPRMDGRATIRRLREDDDTRNTPIIVLTASQLDRDSERAQILGMGVNELLRKPVSIDRLVAEINKYLVAAPAHSEA